MTRNLYDTFGMHFEEFKIRLFSINVTAEDVDEVLRARKKVRHVSQLHVLEERISELHDDEIDVLRYALERTPLNNSSIAILCLYISGKSPSMCECRLVCR